MSGPHGPDAPGRPGQAEAAARALSFGTDAAGYDEARPSYPEALVDDLLAGAGAGAGPVLDVGCGTGKLARQLTARGASVLGVEADERMAAVARSHGIAVEVSRFEDFDPAGRRFALCTAAQAWHWVDPVAGPAKAATALVPGGQLALLWNLREQPDPAVTAAFDACYRQLAPELAGTTMVLGGPPEARGLEAHLDLVTASGSFVDGEVRRYRWQTRYDTAAWRALLSTQSDHRLLDPARRERLLDGAARVVDDLGGVLDIAYVTLALLARRRADEPAGAGASVGPDQQPAGGAG